MANRTKSGSSLKLKLLQTSGPIVRIAPNLCSVSDPADLKTVYSGKFNKSLRSYGNKHVAGIEHLLILREPRAVKARRGLLQPLFQRAHLETFYPEMERYTSILLRQIEGERKAEGNVDVYRWLRLIAFDIIGMSFFVPGVLPCAHTDCSLCILQACLHTEWTWR